MTPAPQPQRTRSVLGDALRALAVLAPESEPLAVAVLGALKLRVAVAPTPPRAAEPPVFVPPPSELPSLSAVTKKEEPAPQQRLPPIVRSALEQLQAPAGAPPSWLLEAPLMPLPTSRTGPARYENPPFDPRWQRALLTRLSSTLAAAGELDVEAIVERIANARPLSVVPRRPQRSVARGVQLLVDRGEAMEPYRVDVAHLVTAMRRSIGTGAVSVLSFTGHPEQGCESGIDAVDYRLPPPGTPIVVVSDFGHGRSSSRSATPEWVRFFTRLARAGYASTGIAPLRTEMLPSAMRRVTRFVTWDRSTRVSRVMHRVAKATAPASSLDCETQRAALAELLCVASLATRLEPQLLRALRLEVCRDVPIDTEADLWFGDCVEDRSVTGVVLSAAIRAEYQNRLRLDVRRLERAYSIVAAWHESAPPALRMEEELTYRWLSDDEQGARALVRSFVATLVKRDRPGVARWASQALGRAPRELRLLEEARMLAFGAALRVDAEPPPPQALRWDWLKPHDLEITLGLTLREGVLQFGPSGSHYLKVPATHPVWLDLIAEGTSPTRVRLNPRETTQVPISRLPVNIRVVGGGHFRLNRYASSFISRNRAPRVQIEYEVVLHGAEKKVELPFVVGVMADLSGTPSIPLPPIAERKFLEFSVDNFDERMGSIKPCFVAAVRNTLTEVGLLEVELYFEGMRDFSPGAIAARVPVLEPLLRARSQLANLITYMDGRTVAEELLAKCLGEPGWFARTDGPALLAEAFKPSTDRAREEIETAVRTLLEQPLARIEPVGKDVTETIQETIGRIDERLSKQLNEILHHPDLQALEGSWRGLHYLVNNTETDRDLKIRVANFRKQDLQTSLLSDPGVELDQSPLFKKLYEDEYGVLGGEPYGCIVGDYSFDHQPGDVELLVCIAKICATCHAPFLTGAAPSLLGLGTWQELRPRDAEQEFEAPEYAHWRTLRESDDARYVGLTLPRFLARLPYGTKTDPVEEFDFEEDSSSGDNKFTWANAAYLMASNVARSFKIYGWCSRIRGIESGGAIEGLPTYTFPTDTGDADPKSPAEIGISDRSEAALAKAGFMPFIHKKNADFSAFIGAQSLQRPPLHDDPDRTANAALAARLPYLLVASRFAHYVRCIVRDRLGSFKGREDTQRWLQDWLGQYVDRVPDQSGEQVKAQRPLAFAEIQLADAENKHEYYDAILRVRPHYQIEGLTQPMEFAFRLPKL